MQRGPSPSPRFFVSVASKGFRVFCKWFRINTYGWFPKCCFLKELRPRILRHRGVTARHDADRASKARLMLTHEYGTGQLEF